MLIRYATLALLIPVLGGTPAWAQNAPKMNYLREVIDLTELIPPPPPRESEAWKQDLAEVLEMQQNRTDMQVRRAIADNVLSIYRFEDVLGPKYKKQNLPVTDAFFEKLHSDQRAILIAPKNALQRLRPVVAHRKEVLALGGNPRLPTGYPSGELQREQDPKSPFVFMSERGSPFTTSGFARMVERVGMQAKLGFKAHPHMLRHACGFALANKGRDTRALQAYLGHKNIQHTVRYTELSPDRFKDFWR